MTRLCDSAVECSRSMASVAMVTAVSKPKVKSVPLRSLSIVFGTPTMRRPSLAMRVAAESVPSPPMAMTAWISLRSMARLHLLQAVLDLEGVDAGGAQDGAAAVEDAGGGLAREAEVVVLEETLPPIAQAHHLEAMGDWPGGRRRG